MYGDHVDIFNGGVLGHYIWKFMEVTHVLDKLGFLIDDMVRYYWLKDV